MINQTTGLRSPDASWIQQSSRFFTDLARKFGLHITRDPHSLVYREHLSRVFSTLEINCALDVGSYQGEFARSLRQLGYGGRIVSFEPVASNFQVLEERHHRDPEWRGYRMALGAKKGSAEIRVFSGTTFHSFLDPSEYGRLRFPEKMQIERTEVVAIERLDNILDTLIEGIANPRIFLKVDTQGYDLEVIKGLGASIQLIKALQIEMAVTPIYENVTNSFIDAVAYMQELGFQLSGVFPVTFDSVNVNCLVEFDCVMCRQTSTPSKPTSLDSRGSLVGRRSSSSVHAAPRAAPSSVHRAPQTRSAR